MDSASSGRLGRAPGSHPGTTLTDAVMMTLWPKPLTHNSRPLNEVARWATPNSSDPMGSRSTPEGTSSTGARPDGRKAQVGLPSQARGLAPPPSSVATESTASFRLNPRFSLWLMGLPAGWLDSELWAMPSSRFKPTSQRGRSTKS